MSTEQFHGSHLRLEWMLQHFQMNFGSFSGPEQYFKNTAQAHARTSMGFSPRRRQPLHTLFDNNEWIFFLFSMVAHPKTLASVGRPVMDSVLVAPNQNPLNARKSTHRNTTRANAACRLLLAGKPITAMLRCVEITAKSELFENKSTNKNYCCRLCVSCFSVLPSIPT